MFGYTVKAEWIRVIVHIAYLTIALPLVVWVYRKEIPRSRTEETSSKLKRQNPPHKGDIT
jgi:hypothetical protein